MKKILFVALSAFCLGCQNPRSSYMSGLIIFTSTSSLGIGFGQYMELPAGGKFEYSSSSPSILADGIQKTSYKADNEKVEQIKKEEE